MKQLSPQLSPGSSVALFSRGILGIPFLSEMLGVRFAHAGSLRAREVSAVAGWGGKPNTRRAREYANVHGLPYVSLEDGFLRSFGTGDQFPPLSIVADDEGLYYDSTRPSSLELMLNSGVDLLSGIQDDVQRAKELILRHRLSKYNHAPLLDEHLLRSGDRRRVLVIDQTLGDMSVSLGGADAESFRSMLQASYDENPKATVYVKTHPEVSSGRKGGYLTGLQDNGRTVLLRDPLNPMSLIEQMDRVYVVSSTMGFEALLAGKPVSCFGLPWYAGWGVTDDRLTCSRRVAKRSVDELFAAAYFHYTRYLDPVTHQCGTIFDVIDWLVRQKEFASKYPGRIVGVGFRRWKAASLAPLLSLRSDAVRFVRDSSAAKSSEPARDDGLVVWGQNKIPELLMLNKNTGAMLLRMEDGFVRSVGLGSDLIRPLSVVLDGRGIYFDPSQPSDLEHILLTTEFSAAELQRARLVREFIIRHGITKYNHELLNVANWPSGGRPVVLVTGQVEDDASIRLACPSVKRNQDLLKMARQSHPDAFIVYKPHPDVLSGNRAGQLALKLAMKWADHIESGLSVVSCIEKCDVLHTMTSLSGFDALLRGKKVVTWGEPFYAGWGLTEDRLLAGRALGRRDRKLQLDELVAGTLLRYPIYWDWDLKGYTTCEAVLNRIVETRERLERQGTLAALRIGYFRRQRRKLGILIQTWLRASNTFSMIRHL